MAWIHVNYHSEVLRMPVSMEVILPQSVSADSESVKKSGPYPTLYLLHEMGGNHTAWLRRTRLEQYVEGLPLAVVMPAGHLGFYTDMAYGRDYFRFITEELPRICESFYPLSKTREGRFIAGPSIGGYGAIKAGLLASSKFSHAASISGAMDVINIFDSINENLARDVFGSKENLQGRMNDLFSVAQYIVQSKKPQTKLYMWNGTNDTYYSDNIRFRDHLQSLGLPLTYEKGAADPSWASWDRAIKRIIKWLPIGQDKLEEGGG